MGQPFVGEIRIFAGNFAPVGWAFCDGSPQAISENDQLFALIGTTYGGDGEQTFNLPDLRGRVPMHRGQGPAISQNYQLGEAGGVESVTVTVQQMAAHTHPELASNSLATDFSPGAQVLAQATTTDIYITGTPTQSLHPSAISPIGGSQPHTNVQPMLCINFIIALFGVYPTQN